MTNQNFSERLARIEARSPTVSPDGLMQQSSPWKPARLLLGFVASLAVWYLFQNIQAISDAAPEAIKNSAYPGAFGVPVAVLTVAWLIFVPIACFRTLRRIAGQIAGEPNNFAIGAFAGLVVCLLAFKFMG